jgi:hypothetical protein
MNKCIECGIELIEGVNVFHSSLKAKDYKCKSCVKSRTKKWIQNNPERYKESCYNQNQKWSAENRIKKSEYQKQYNELNSEKRRQYETKRRKTQPHLSRWRDLLKRSKNGIKSKTTQELLGYSAKQLKEHLDKQGMDWDKHHIDHKIPISWFKKDTPPHIVNDLRNIQPLLPEENQSKSNIFGDLVPPSYIYDIETYIKTKYKIKLWQLGAL